MATSVDSILRDAVPRVAPALQLVVLRRGQPILTRTLGWLDPPTRDRPVTADTRFDLASLTKLYVVAAFMTLLEAGRVSLDDAVAAVLPQFNGERPIQPYEHPLQKDELVHVVPETGAVVDASTITFRHLLAHTSGLPAWRPLFRLGSAEAARDTVLHSFFSYPPGEHIIYSDIGLILLGLAVEQLTGEPLDAAVHDLTLAPLSLLNTSYRRLPTNPLTTAHSSLITDTAPTEQCAWRQRRLLGEVHDENAARLGGVAGHAGLFATASDVAAFGQSFLDASLLRADTVAAMTKSHARDGELRRGLGFALHSVDPEASSHPFGQRVFGHTGFTGTSLWIDPARDFVVALLTNRVYHGRDAAGIGKLRVDVHRAVVEEFS